MKELDEGETRKQMMIRMYLVAGKRIALGISPQEDIHQDCACGDKIQQCRIYRPDEKQTRWYLERVPVSIVGLYTISPVFSNKSSGCHPRRVRMRGRTKKGNMHR